MFWLLLDKKTAKTGLQPILHHCAMSVTDKTIVPTLLLKLWLLL